MHKPKVFGHKKLKFHTILLGHVINRPGLKFHAISGGQKNYKKIFIFQSGYGYLLYLDFEESNFHPCCSPKAKIF